MKDGVLADLGKDADKKKKDLLTKLRQTAGMPMSKEDQDRYLQEMD